MGLLPITCRLLVREHKASPFSGSVCTLGNQDVFATYEDLKAIFQQFNVKPVEVTPRPHTSDYIPKYFDYHGLAERPFVHAQTLFEMMGLRDYTDIDIRDVDAASLNHDLNYPLPDELKGKFGVVLDAGTVEHVFDAAQALKNMVSLCQVGGHVVHFAPVIDDVDHGFYALNPTLFFDFYGQNGFTDMVGYIYIPNEDEYQAPCPYFRYTPGMDTRPFIPPKKRVYFFFVARKDKDMHRIEAPLQGKYTPSAPPDLTIVPPTAPLLKRLLGPVRPLLMRLYPPYKRLAVM